MSAADRFPYAMRAPHRFHQWQAMCDEIDRLERWQAESLQVDDLWDAAWERVQPLGLVGQFRSVCMADEILRLRAEVAALRADKGEP